MAKVIQVSCLVMLDKRGCVFAARRPADKSLALLWEFPGGKVEPGEDPEGALRREIQEELHLHLDQLSPLTRVSYNYDFANIELIPFLARCEERPPINLVEHVDSCWIALDKVYTLKWAPADIPIVEELLIRGSNRS